MALIRGYRDGTMDLKLFLLSWTLGTIINAIFLLAATPLEAFSGTLIFFVIYLGRVVAPSPKIVVNLPGTYEKLLC